MCPGRELVSAIGPRVPISEIGSLADFNERSYATPLWLGRAAVLLGGIGLLLATAGLYGVASYVVAMRSQEVAIRIAIGASPRAIIAWSRLAKVWALLRCGRAEVYPEDVQALAPYVLGHRIWLGPHAASHGLTTDDVIRDVVEEVSIP